MLVTHCECGGVGQRVHVQHIWVKVPLVLVKKSRKWHTNVQKYGISSLSHTPGKCPSGGQNYSHPPAVRYATWVTTLPCSSVPHHHIHILLLSGTLIFLQFLSDFHKIWHEGTHKKLGPIGSSKTCQNPVRMTRF